MADTTPQYVTPYKYAELCGVSPTAINRRIKRGVLDVEEFEQPDGSMKRFIDTKKYPPSKLIDYPIEFKGRKDEKR